MISAGPVRGRAGTLSPQLSSLLDRELTGGVAFFWEQANPDPDSPGYGLIPDRYGRGESVASIAAVGFGLAALAIGAARGQIDPDAARDRVRGTLATLSRVPAHRGFWTHFVDLRSIARHKLAEFSTIDTALALCGAITAAGYFDDPEITERTQTLLERVDWDFLVHERDSRMLLRMAYNADRGGDYAGDADFTGMIGAWDMTAEQLCMYLLAAGHPDVPADLARALYHGFDRPIGSWGGEPFVHTPGGAMFIYQFSHAFFAFQDWRDDTGFDWFENSQRAILANRQWCIDHHDQFRTLGPHLWGLTAGDGLESYIVSGPPVRGDTLLPYCEGTVHSYSLTGAMPFIPDVAGESIMWLDRHHPGMWGRYGLHDAINLEGPTPVYLETVLGIDKGPSVLLVDDFLHGTTWRAFGSHPWIKRAVEKLGWQASAEPPAQAATPVG